MRSLSMIKNKNNKSQVAKSSGKEILSDVNKYSNSPYFVEKARKAKEFLKEHPIPQRFIK